MNWFFIFCLIAIVSDCHSSDDHEDGVSIEEEDEPTIEPILNAYDKFIKKHQDFSRRIKKDTDNFLNTYIKNLKDVNYFLN